MEQAAQPLCEQDRVRQRFPGYQVVVVVVAAACLVALVAWAAALAVAGKPVVAPPCGWMSVGWAREQMALVVWPVAAHWEQAQRVTLVAVAA